MVILVVRFKSEAEKLGCLEDPEMMISLLGCTKFTYLTGGKKKKNSRADAGHAAAGPQPLFVVGPGPLATPSPTHRS